MKSLSFKKFVSLSHIDEKLVKAVVRQSGGYDEFKEHALHLQSMGAECGFNGFVWHNETIAFSKRNRKAIMGLANEQARDFGEKGALEMIAGFNRFKRDNLNTTDISNAIYEKGEYETTVLNALAWYSLEEVARSYNDILEQGEF